VEGARSVEGYKQPGKRCPVVGVRGLLVEDEKVFTQVYHALQPVPVAGRPEEKAKSVRTTEATRACKAKKKYRHNLRTVLPTMCAVSNVSAALQSYSLPIWRGGVHKNQPLKI
jgi:hypothetical protein